MKRILGIVVATTIVGFAAHAMAQQVNPMLDQGTSELELSGSIDFEGPTGGTDWALGGGYGFFVVDFVEVGVRGRYSRFDDGNLEEFVAGVFGEYNLEVTPIIVPYGGASANWHYVDIEDVGDEDAGVLSPYAGIKWFVTDYFAVDTRVSFLWATEDLFVNDRDAENTDWRGSVGLRVFF